MPDQKFVPGNTGPFPIPTEDEPEYKSHLSPGITITEVDSYPISARDWLAELEKFDETAYIDEITEYITETYGEHYSNGIQVTEFIMSHADTPDFLKGNVLKYVVRYGKKDGYNRKDILKAMHYLFLMLHFHDDKFAKEKSE